MQAITPELEAILKNYFQAGDSGYRAKITVDGIDYFPESLQVDHSLQTMADALSATFTNENGEVGLAEDAFPINALFTAWAWYGDEANALCVFTGFIDKVVEHRDPKTVTITCRDWAKPLLVQDILVTAPQDEGEAGAVRTTANFVYLNREISYIVNDLLNKAGYPATARAIQNTNFVLDEWHGRDGSSYADAIKTLADIIAFNAFADELGVYHFQPDGLADSTTDDPPTPVYTFRTGEDIMALDPQRDDYDTKTRVRAVGPYTTLTLQDAWTELWHTNVIKNPTGVWYEAGDTNHLNIADGPLRKIYRISQLFGRSIVSSRDLSGVITYLNGLSGDPSSALHYWTFDTPWITGAAVTNNKIRKHLKSDNSVVATFTLANQRWTDMKVGDDAIWCTNFSTNKIHKLSKTTGAEIASYAVPGHTQPIGVAIDGTDLFLSFYAEATMLQVTTTDPTTVVRTLRFSGTKSLGGDIDTDTHTELYACSGGLSLTYKYTLKEFVADTHDVAVEIINEDLEAELGVELDTGIEVRRLVLRLDMIESPAQASEAAARWLDKLDQFRNILDVGILGNPAIQKADMVRVVDPVTLIDAEFQVDTHRFSLSGDGSFLGTMALVPWTSSYAGPGDIIPTPLDYDAAVIATGPLSYWPLGDTSGTSAIDLMGLHNGTYIGSPALNQPGLIVNDSSGAAGLSPGKYVDLTGSSDYHVDPGTIVIWFKTSAPGSGVRYLFDLPLAFSLYIQSVYGNDNKLHTYVWGGVPGEGTAPDVVTDDVPHMAALKFASAGEDFGGVGVGHRHVLYLDGVEVENGTWFAADYAHHLEVGSASDYDSGASLTAVVQKAAIWDRPLSDTEIAELYAIGIGS